MRFGTVLENVAIDPDLRLLDFNDAAVTENTRAAYPLTFIGNAVTSGVMRIIRSNIVLLTCDAFGVLPPLAKLSPEQAMYPLPERLHGEGGGNREGSRQGAASDIQRLFRRALPAPSGKGLRGAAGREDAHALASTAGW